VQEGKSSITFNGHFINIFPYKHWMAWFLVSWFCLHVFRQILQFLLSIYILLILGCTRLYFESLEMLHFSSLVPITHKNPCFHTIDQLHSLTFISMPLKVFRMQRQIYQPFYGYETRWCLLVSYPWGCTLSVIILSSVADVVPQTGVPVTCSRNTLLRSVSLSQPVAYSSLMVYWTSSTWYSLRWWV